MFEYLRAVVAPSGDRGRGAGAKPLAKKVRRAVRSSPASGPPSPVAVDRTPKLFIGGKQARPDSGYSLKIHGADGTLLGQVGEGNRKDIRNAVEAAHAAASSWRTATGHARAQILYYLAENLSSRADDFATLLDRMTGNGIAAAHAEVEASVSRLFTYGAWADKYDGAVHNVPIRGVALAMNEPVGVMGIICPEDAPLLSLISLLAPVMAMGNVAVVVPGAKHALAATELYTVLETSDVPKGVVNIVTGKPAELAKTLSEHDDVDGVWYFGDADGIAAVERASADNMKRTWTSGDARDWSDPRIGEGREFLRHATEVKNIWVPYGE